MPQYTIKATVIKTIVADSEEEAHELFSVACDGGEEHYEQETISEKE